MSVSLRLEHECILAFNERLYSKDAYYKEFNLPRKVIVQKAMYDIPTKNIHSLIKRISIARKE